MNVGTVARVKMGNCGGFRSVKVKGEDSSSAWALRVVWALALHCSLTQAKVQGPPAASLQIFDSAAASLRLVDRRRSVSHSQSAFNQTQRAPVLRASLSRIPHHQPLAASHLLLPQVRPNRIPRLSHRRRECVRDGSRPSAGLLGRRRRCCWLFDSSSPSPEIQRGLPKDPPRPIC